MVAPLQLTRQRRHRIEVTRLIYTNKTQFHK